MPDILVKVSRSEANHMPDQAPLGSQTDVSPSVVVCMQRARSVWTPLRVVVQVGVHRGAGRRRKLGGRVRLVRGQALGNAALHRAVHDWDTGHGGWPLQNQHT